MEEGGSLSMVRMACHVDTLSLTAPTTWRCSPFGLDIEAGLEMWQQHLIRPLLFQWSWCRKY